MIYKFIDTTSYMWICTIDEFIYIKDLSDGKCDSCEERHISQICVLFPREKDL